MYIVESMPRPIVTARAAILSTRLPKINIYLKSLRDNTMLNNYKGNSAHLKALKLARIEQHIADGVVYLSLSLGVVAMFTFLNWAMIARYGV